MLVEIGDMLGISHTHLKSYFCVIDVSIFHVRNVNAGNLAVIAKDPEIRVT